MRRPSSERQRRLLALRRQVQQAEVGAREARHRAHAFHLAFKMAQGERRSALYAAWHEAREEAARLYWTRRHLRQALEALKVELIVEPYTQRTRGRAADPRRAGPVDRSRSGAGPRTARSGATLHRDWLPAQEQGGAARSRRV